MMPTVRTTCPGCNGREVDLMSDDILLLFRGDDEEGTYAFVCPQCGELQDKPAPRRLAQVLIVAEVPWIDLDGTGNLD